MHVRDIVRQLSGGSRRFARARTARGAGGLVERASRPFGQRSCGTDVSPVRAAVLWNGRLARSGALVERASRPFEEWPTESPSFLNGQDARSTIAPASTDKTDVGTYRSFRYLPKLPHRTARGLATRR